MAENIFLSHLPTGAFGFLKKSVMRRSCSQLLEQLQLAIDPDTVAGELSSGQMQLLELAKALSLDANIIIFDEPTSSLSEREVDILFRTIQNLREQGKSIVYISHKLDEIFHLTDRVTIMRDGETILTENTSELDSDRVIQAMVGRELNQLYPGKTTATEKARYDQEALSLENWQVIDKQTGKTIVQSLDLSVKSGEIFGVSGLMGSMRSELLLSLFGHDKYLCSGRMYVDGKAVIIDHPRDAIDNGMALLTEDRKTSGLHLEHSIADNMSLASLGAMKQSFGMIDREKLKTLTWELVRKLRVKTPDTDQPVRNLSGGNQQKVAIAKWLATEPRLLFLDEPTRGIDVNAKYEIYQLMRRLVDEGLTIIMVSSELPEILGMADRVAVMKEGSLQCVLEGAEVNATSVMNQAIGVKS